MNETFFEPREKMEYTSPKLGLHLSAATDMFGTSGYTPQKLAKIKRKAGPEISGLFEKVIDASPKVDAEIMGDLLKIASESTSKVAPAAPSKHRIIAYAKRILTPDARCN